VTRALTLGLLWLAAAHSAAGQSLSKNDHTEIHELYARYAQAADASNAEAYGGVFTPDGVFVIEDPTGALGGPGGTQTFNGRTAIAALMRGPRRERPKVTHVYSNIVVDPAPEGAKGMVYVILIDLQRNPSITGGGVCDDRLARTKDGWRFTKRICHVEPRPAASAASTK
jgi:hypothetical protein